MPTSLTSEQVLALAPDPASIKSGKDLASPRKWASLGCTDESAWGECQGSGSLPYQVRADLTELAFKCTCPSRKFPCKHSIALLLMLVEQQAVFTQKESPGWVTEWMESRRNRAEKKAKKTEEEEDKPVDAAAQAKRVEQRKNKVAAGITELDMWLQDVLRQGLAGMRAKPFAFWEAMAARLVDSQAPGLARLVRDCAGVSSQGEGWQEKLLERLGSIYLIVEAYSRIEVLSENMQEELKSIIGFTVNHDELLKQEGVRDTWEITGQRVEREDRLRVQRTWLYGRNTQKWALILSFAHGTGMLDTSLSTGQFFEGELVFFPGVFPLRALVKSRQEQSKNLNTIVSVSVESALQNYSQALSLNPWIESFPMSIENVIPIFQDNSWWVADQEDRALPLSIDNSAGWQLMTLSGGIPLNIFGEWEQNALKPLTISARDTLVSMA